MFKMSFSGFLKVLAVVSVLPFILGSANLAYSGPKNCAKNKTVAVDGKFFTGGWKDGLKTDYSSIVDGVFFESGHQWNEGPVWWDERDGHRRSLTVFLGKVKKVCKIVIQVDAWDDYIIKWQDVRKGPKKKKVIPPRRWGMSKRIHIKVNAKTDAFTIQHKKGGKGDGLYAVSEFKAMTCD